MAKVFDKNIQYDLLKLLEELPGRIITDKEAEDYCLRLIKIYDVENFRHSYSEITSFIISLYKKDETDLVESLNSNIRIILDVIKRNCDENLSFYTSVYKLYDHINMECIRCSFYKEYESEVDETIRQIELARKEVKEITSDSECYNDLKATNKKIKTAMSNIKTFSKENKKLQNQVISILGIFSAVVIAFFGGFSYFTSTFANLHKVRIVKATIISSIIGLVIFNTIYILLNFILHFVKSSEEQDNIESNNEDNIKPFGKYITIWTNIFLVIIILAATSYWFFTK